MVQRVISTGLVFVVLAFGGPLSLGGAQEAPGMRFSEIDIWDGHPGITLRLFRLVAMLLSIYAVSVFVVRCHAVLRLLGSTTVLSVYRESQRRGLDRAACTRAMERAVRARCHTASRGVRSLLTVGLIAPLVGAMGLVAGLTNVFRGLALTAGGGLVAVSAGVVEAFEPLAIGLLLGMVSFWGYVFLVGQLESARYNMTRMMERARSGLDS